MMPRAAHAIAFLSVLALLVALRSAVRRRAVVDVPAAEIGGSWSDGSEGSRERCPRALSWRLARIDPRFGMGKAAAEAAVDGAASLWEAAVGRGLFVRDTVRGLPIRFTYDERQAEGVARRAAERALQAPLDSLEARDFRKRYRTVEGEAARYSEVVRAEGERIVAVDREIRVYRFDGPSDLERIVAHELGHALGLGHAAAEGAIMSERLELGSEISRPSALHPADVELLREACGEWFGSAAPATTPTPAPTRRD